MYGANIKLPARIAALGIALGAVTALVLALRGPDQPVAGIVSANTLKPVDSVLRVRTWNIHYGVGPEDDRGDLRGRQQVLGYLDGIVDSIRKSDPDILCLQETDFKSHRTHDIDEVSYIADALGYPHVIRVVTWDVLYLPYPYTPISQHYGHMKSGQAILSRFAPVATDSLRHPQPAANAWWYNWFYLHRTTQQVDFVLPGGGRLALFNVHLEAFDQPNRELQARQLHGMIARAIADGKSVIAMGDFNAIPRGAKLRRAFEDEPLTDMTTDTTIDILKQGTGLTDVLETVLQTDDHPGLWTFPAWKPNRRLDYILISPQWRVIFAQAVDETAPMSDHRSIEAVLEYANEKDK